ncbi:MAG: hypothetical protein QOG80_2878 [Pseudonocardiales bacterium]|jgi:anti-sigma regulatory factor (Ser/Thr protein kinase)|nr:hypothetical protein [Pseudonocardiales bacterium]
MATLLVPHETTSAALVRRAMRADLARQAVPPDSVDEVVLVASELVGNAILHTAPAPSGELAVAWRVDAGSITVQVDDQSALEPRPRQPTVDAPSGRGLTIVDALAADWGFERHAGGKHVWARVPIQPGSPRMTRSATDKVARSI